jgi:hypothetical protein
VRPARSTSRIWLGWQTVALAVGMSVAIPTLAAQEVPVPVRVQVPLLFRILSFDRNLARRRAGDLVVAVLYQSRNRSSLAIAEEVTLLLGSLSSTEAVGIDLDKVTDLRAALAQSGGQVLYVSPLRGVEISGIVRVSRGAGVTTVTGVPRYVEEGISIGLDLKAERPEIVVNLEGARAEGADFTAQLLKLARLVKGGPRAP